VPPPALHPVVAPQKFRLVWGSTHVPPQLTRPVWHESEQLPVLQTLPPLHTAPALPPAAPHPVVAPQWTRFNCGSTHVPLQSIRPAWHERAQLPPLQTRPAAQTAPALPPPKPHPAVAPQELRLVCGSTHVPLQFTRPDWQESAQLPPLQTLPPLQVTPAVPPATPHPVVAPQKTRLVLESTQLPLQSISPGGHDTAQRPAAQT
jgi:hypothetical protein